MNKYEVKCKCGHVGKHHYIVISFPVCANNGKEAASKARKIPRVKHNHKDAILSVKRITDEEFMCLVNSNREDLYLRCQSKQEQSLIDLTNRIYSDDIIIKEKSNQEKHKQCFYGKVEVRHPKKFFKNVLNYDYNIEEVYA